MNHHIIKNKMKHGIKGAGSSMPLHPLHFIPSSSYSMLFHFIIAIQLLLPSLAFNETNADSAQIDVAPISFRDAASFIAVAGIFCLCMWFVLKRCRIPKPQTNASAA
jgi:hypothetical protein